jgi:two-component system invasion response regulator UvrY
MGARTAATRPSSSRTAGNAAPGSPTLPTQGSAAEALQARLARIGSLAVEATDQRLHDLAAAIHAEPIQRLVAATVALDRLRARLPSDSPDSGDVAAAIDRVSADLEETVDLLRRLVAASLHADPHRLRPSREDGCEPDAGSGKPELGSPSGQVSRAPRTIVVCDDHRDLRGAVVAALADPGGFCVVGQAWDARTCLDEVIRSRPDLLILDVGLPGGGPELASAVKGANPSTRIVVFSGHDDAATEEAMLAAGADRYVVKTGRLRRLMQVLDELS